MARDAFFAREPSHVLAQRTRELSARLTSPEVLTLDRSELASLRSTYAAHVRELRARRDYKALDEALHHAGVTS
jgi:hypothetical protein